MKIAIDIDNTILRHTSIGYKLANVFQIGHNGKTLKYKEISMWDRHQDPLIVKMISKALGLDNASNYTVDHRFKNVLTHILEKGHSVVFVSSRPNWDCLNLVLFDILYKAGLPDAKIILECNNKIKFLLENGISFLVDSNDTLASTARKSNITVTNFDKICEYISHCDSKNP